MPSSPGVGATARTKRLRVILNTVERAGARGVDVARLVETIMFNMGLQRPRAEEHVAFLVELHKLVRVGGLVYGPAYAPGGASAGAPVEAPAGEAMVLEEGPSAAEPDGDDDGADRDQAHGGERQDVPPG